MIELFGQWSGQKGGGVGKQWSIFPDFGTDPDFFQEIGPEMVRIYIQKSGFY